MALATALAAGPRLVAEVWHKDKYTADQLLGLASVSLAPLLQEPVVDGRAVSNPNLTICSWCSSVPVPRTYSLRFPPWPGLANRSLV